MYLYGNMSNCTKFAQVCSKQLNKLFTMSQKTFKSIPSDNFSSNLVTLYPDFFTKMLKGSKVIQNSQIVEMKRISSCIKSHSNK